MKIKTVINFLEQEIPLSYQEDYDNSGLLIGDAEKELKFILISLDITEDVINEAINTGCNFIVAHHPIIFGGLTKITGSNYVERSILKAIKNDIAIYAAHTNADNIFDGVTNKMAQKLNLENLQILVPKNNYLKKLITFVPQKSISSVRNALFEAGAGHIGNYDSCSFNIVGKGTFKGNENTAPYVGKPEKLHFEEEIRIETIFPKHLQSQIIEQLLIAHPYEEVAYDIYPLENTFKQIGSGLIGELTDTKDEKEFLQELKNTFKCKTIRHTKLLNKKIKKVALCGGAGNFLLPNAQKAEADIFISADFKYHQFFDAENKIVIADIGHYESEQFTKEYFYDVLIKKIPKFALFISEENTNPINYF